jgi:hypothetical protein
MNDSPSAPDLDDWDLPEHWTSSARDLFAEVLSERPDISGADLGSLEQACELSTAAEALAAVAREAGYVSTGSTGQIVAHPAGIEARLARTAAATILARLAPSRADRFTDRARHAARSRYQSGS